MGLRMFRRKHPQKPSASLGVGHMPVATADPVVRDPEHLFNQPNIQALDFLIAVMRDPRTPISIRVQVAGWLSEHFPEPQHYIAPHLTIVIPPLPEGYLQ